MNHANFEKMEDGDWYASIPGLNGLWATGATKEDATKDLFSALEAWLDVNAQVGKMRLPIFDGLNPEF